MIASHAEVIEGLHHPMIGHQIEKHLSPYSLQHDAMRWTPPDPVSARQLIVLDPPDHTRLRRLVSAGFTAHMVDRLEPWISDLVDKLLARIPRDDIIDGVKQLAEPVPVAVIAELVGVPREDRPRFRAWSTAIVSGGVAGTAATAEFARYIDELATRRKTCPEDDLVSI